MARARTPRAGGRAGPSHERPPDIFDQIASRTRSSRAVVIEEWGERAAIREYLGGMSRREAEKAAIADCEAALFRQWDVSLPF